MRAALTVSSLLLAAWSVAAEPFEDLVQRQSLGQPMGCYDNSPVFTNKTQAKFQSTGWCQDFCTDLKAAVFATTNRVYCACGDELPPASAKASSNMCNTPCQGYPPDTCGGKDTYSVFLTGVVQNVPVFSPSKSTTDSSNNSSTSTQDGQSGTTSSGGQTVTVIAPSQNAQSSQPASSQNSSSGSNTAAIAAGVVVGVVGLAAVVGAAFLFYRSRKRRAESDGAAGAGRFYNSPPSMSESRYDGEYMAKRRQSNGSIDEDHDFSRRILQVANPDHHY